jgi:hypothetical protein
MRTITKPIVEVNPEKQRYSLDSMIWYLGHVAQGKANPLRLLSGLVWAVGAGVFGGVAIFCIAITEQYKAVYNDYMWSKITLQVEKYVQQLMSEHPDKVLLALDTGRCQFFRDAATEKFPQLFNWEMADLVEEIMRRTANRPKPPPAAHEPPPRQARVISRVT